MTGRVTPRGTQPRRRRAYVFRTVGHYLRPTPRGIHLGEQKSRYCTCGAMMIGPADTIDERWRRHRCGLPDPKPSLASRVRKRLRRHLPRLPKLRLPRLPAWRAVTPLAAIALLFLLFDVHGAPQRQSLLRQVEEDWTERGWDPDDLKTWTMATRVAAAGGGNFTAGGTWVGGVAPTAADDAQLAGTSGNVTIDTGSVCRSLDCTGYTGTLTHTAGVTLTIGTSSAGASNIALKFVAGMTYTLGSSSTSAIAFTSTVASTTMTIDTAGKTMGNVTFTSATTSVHQLVTNGYNTGSAATVTHNQGGLDTNGLACSWGTVAQNSSNTKTFTPGASQITITQNGGRWLGAGSGLTVTANTATITFTGSDCDFNSGSWNWNGLSLVWTGAVTSTNGGFTGISNFTIANLTVTATAVASLFFIHSNINVTVTGNIVFTGNNANSKRLLVTIVSPGSTKATLTCNGTVTGSSNVDFEDIAAAGSASWNLSAITGGSGNAGGCTGITFTTAAPQYWVGNAGSFSNSAKWASSSGGTGGTGRVPLPQDAAVIDANSVTTGSQTITMDMPRLGASLDTTGVLNTPTVLTTVIWRIFGGVTLTGVTNSLFNQSCTFSGRGTHTITLATAGSISTNTNFNTPGATYTLGAAFSSTGSISWASNTSGLATTFNTANYAITCTDLNAQGSAGTNLKFNAGTSLITITGVAGALMSWSGGAGGEFNGENATITLSGVAPTGSGPTAQRILRFDSNTQRAEIGTLNITNAQAANVRFNSNATGLLRIGTLNVASQHSITVFSGSTVNVKNFVVNGVNNGYLYLGGYQDGVNYASVPDSAALSITGDITLDFDTAADTWTPVSNSILISKWGASAGASGYRFILDTGGRLILTLSQNGTASTSATSSVATGYTAGTRHQVRACWRASDGRVQFFTRDTDSDTWVQLGSNQSIALASIFDNANVVEIGHWVTNTSNGYAGKVYKARLYNADKGTTESTANLQLLADFTTKAFGANTFTEGSSNAATVTINGVVAQAGDGRVSIDASTAASAGLLNKMLSDAYGNDLSFHGVLTYNSDNVQLPGTAANFMAARPGTALAAVADQIDVRLRVAATDWTPTSLKLLASQWGPGANGKWDFYLSTDGKLNISVSYDGTNGANGTSSVAPTIADGVTLWVRFTWRKSDGRVQFFTASGALTDPLTADWTQLGTDRTASTAGAALFVGSSAYVNLGSELDGQAVPFTGKFYRAQIRNNILDDGTGIVFDMDFTNPNQGSVEGKYLTVKDSTVKGRAQYIAVDSADKTGNTGWAFLPPDSPPRRCAAVPRRSEALHRASRW